MRLWHSAMFPWRCIMLWTVIRLSGLESIIKLNWLLAFFWISTSWVWRSVLTVALFVHLSVQENARDCACEVSDRASLRWRVWWLLVLLSAKSAGSRIRVLVGGAGSLRWAWLVSAAGGGSNPAGRTSRDVDQVFEQAVGRVRALRRCEH